MSTDTKRDTRYFHFTLGPVQSFVAQARRTRDFWAGSFLLSWLSGVAMLASSKQGATIVFPKADDEYLDWLTGDKVSKNKGKDTPRQGSIPNRFKAEINADFKPESVTESVNIAWKTLADLIYAGDIKANENPNTRSIWDQQIENFWDMSWAISDKQDDSSILNRRKNWRSYQAPDESGVKCMMMDGWQELSGIPSPHQQGLALFWNTLRSSRSSGIASDLNEGESLCAIGFVKRRFTRYFEDINAVPMPSSNWKLYGWKLNSSIPSVSYMAAVHWLEEVMTQAKQDDVIAQALTTFDNEAFTLSDRDRGGWENNIRCIRQLITNREGKNSAAHDGNVFFQSVMENKKLYPKQDQAKRVIHAFQHLNRVANVSAVSPFYAMLMMDGDSLGEQMSEISKQANISKALHNFTDDVPTIVDKHNGFLIYAGGDDVLAIFPLDDALNCAKALRDHYCQCFAPYKDINTTLSGAIEYAHIKMPLTKVLHDAHDLLDTVAKEQTGRDSLAIRVWKPGGIAIQWAQPWQVVLSENNEIILNELITIFRDADTLDPQFSSKFFYKIQERFSLLNPPKDSPNNKILDEAQALSLLAMEYLNSQQGTKDSMEEAESKIQPLIRQCRPHYRTKEAKIVSSHYLHAHAALLVRFLAKKGVE